MAKVSNTSEDKETVLGIKYTSNVARGMPDSQLGELLNSQTRGLPDSRTRVKETGVHIDLPEANNNTADRIIVNGHNGCAIENGLPITKAKKNEGGDKNDDEFMNDDDIAQTGCCRQHRKQPAVGTFELFRYAGVTEVLMIIVGSLMAVAAGCAFPINNIIVGDIIDIFVQGPMKANLSGITTGEFIQREMVGIINYFVILACASLVCNYIAISLWTWAGERQVARIRKLFFRAVMRQDMEWFDTYDAGELNSRFSDDMHKISEGMCDKVAVFLLWTSTGASAYIVAFVEGWKLALAVCSFGPLFVIASTVTLWLIRNSAVKEYKAYAKAGSVAEQALRAIRTVQAFQGQEKEEQRYNANLVQAVKTAQRKGLVLGIGGSLNGGFIFIALAVAFWYGVILIQDEGLQPGKIMPVFFCVFIGSMSLGQAFPSLESFSNARAAALKIFQIIDLQPQIDVSSEKGIKISELKGVIEFKNVKFRYPSRADVQVLDGLDLYVDPGQTVALVGASGCGKSTTVQLIQRFYDPEQGQITIDGINIKDLNVSWLREQIGVVSQEPVLFAATIFENIRYGRPDVTQKEIEAAARYAYADDFIKELPLKYDTLVGERGAQLSGGQKQRIAIARALVKNPRILLLDEATSALDHESEAIVQNALEKAKAGRTTIIIAHRLSTIRNADKIVVIDHGRKEEEGSHDDLINKDGLYTQFVQLQAKAENDTRTDASHISNVEEDDSTDDDESVLDNSLHSISFEISGCRRSLSINSKKRERNKKPSKKTEKAEDDVPTVSFRQIMRLNAPERALIIVGLISSILMGFIQPCFAFIVSELIKVFEMTDRVQQRDSATTLGLILIGVGVISAIFRLVQTYFFARSGAALTARLRQLTFGSLLKQTLTKAMRLASWREKYESKKTLIPIDQNKLLQDMYFFDDPDNQVSTLTTNLACDTALVQGATGARIGNVIEAVINIVVALVIAFIYGWKLAFVVLAFMPIIIVAWLIQGRVTNGSSKSEKSIMLEAGKLCSEAIDNIRTVSSLNRSDIFIERLEKLIDSDARRRAKTAQVFGVAFGVANSIIFFAYAASYRFGTELVTSGEMDFYEVFRVFSAIIFGSASIGRKGSYAIDYTKAKMAAARIVALINLKPKIDIDQSGGMKLESCMGRITTQDVVFRYPSRATTVLKGLNLCVETGQTLALVGGSGCGKSTVMQLLQRFYEVDSGNLLVDGHDLKKIDLRWLRQQIGIVSQEPTLFDGSIASNIAYGDNSREVPMADIIEAARKANIHDFIDSLPQGYDTNVGDKGTQLSGGQKQRIAIARALLRQPKILLLDEATSALDTESEKVVQDALDKAREGRTCIVIAHRLTTIQNADKIAVIHKGRVQEIGSHQQLIAKQGLYYKLLETKK